MRRERRRNLSGGFRSRTLTAEHGSTLVSAAVRRVIKSVKVSDSGRRATVALAARALAVTTTDRTRRWRERRWRGRRWRGRRWRRRSIGALYSNFVSTVHRTVGVIVEQLATTAVKDTAFTSGARNVGHAENITIVKDVGEVGDRGSGQHGASTVTHRAARHCGVDIAEVSLAHRIPSSTSVEAHFKTTGIYAARRRRYARVGDHSQRRRTGALYSNFLARRGTIRTAIGKRAFKYRVFISDAPNVVHPHGVCTVEDRVRAQHGASGITHPAACHCGVDIGETIIAHRIPSATSKKAHIKTTSSQLAGRCYARVGGDSRSVNLGFTRAD